MRRSRLIKLLFPCVVLPVLGFSPVQGVVTDSGPQLAVEYKSSFMLDVLEKAQSGKLSVTLDDGEHLEGTFVGYLPKVGAHCAKSWWDNAVAYVSPYPGAGSADLKGNQGTELHCLYSWSQSVRNYCACVAVCKSIDERYFKIEF